MRGSEKWKLRQLARVVDSHLDGEEGLRVWAGREYLYGPRSDPKLAIWTPTGKTVEPIVRVVGRTLVVYEEQDYTGMRHGDELVDVSGRPAEMRLMGSPGRFAIRPKPCLDAPHHRPAYFHGPGWVENMALFMTCAAVMERGRRDRRAAAAALEKS